MIQTESNAILAAECLAGRQLYSWQRRLLLQHLLRGDLPDAIDVPTGLGKTAVISLWLAASAHGAMLPRRLVYVVDRRAVVDQATTEADRLAGTLGAGESADPMVIALREGLGLSAGQQLPVSTLRGQHIDNKRWLEHPSLPAIVIGTVDMIGSRLLFSGYGVSRRMRPVHAGLLGVDALVVLDEAHLVPPFESLVRQLQGLRRLNGHGVEIPAFRVMALSATGRTEIANTFRLIDSDVQDLRVRARLEAVKRLRVLPEVSARDLPGHLASRAWDLAQPSSSVLVFCNSRKTAVEVAAMLRKRVREARGKDANDALELLVGERRVLERQHLAEGEVFRRFLPRGAPDGLGGTTPAFLVATSAGEVGIDLDADHMVCDLVPWERMVQRLGRVNRRAEPSHDAIVEVIPAQVGRGKEEAETDVGADRLKTLLAPFEHPGWPASCDGLHDASAGALYLLKQEPQLQDPIEKASTQPPFGPELTLPLVHAWSMTSLREHSGRPEPQPWIRGWIDDIPQTRVAWRRWFPLRAREDGSWLDESEARDRDLEAFLEAASPHLSEILEAPTSRLVTVLKKRAADWLEKAAKATHAESGLTENGRRPSHRPIVVVLDAAGDLKEPLECSALRDMTSDRLSRVLSGCTVMMDVRLGGLDSSGLLDPDESSPPPTLDQEDDAWPHLTRAAFRIRVAPERSRVVDWPVDYRWPFDPDAEGPDRLELRIEVWRGGSTSQGDPALSRGSQELQTHLDAVLADVSETARGLRLSEPMTSMMGHVAQLHDSGKARNLWQRAMGAPRDGKTYAKTDGRGNPRLLQIAGETYRHEFGSLHDAIKTGRPEGLSDDLHDLGLHLIASHHGFARPAIAAVDPEQPPSACPPLAREAALRFERLNRTWGPWELAWIEALFRAADWKASAAQQKEAGK